MSNKVLCLNSREMESRAARIAGELNAVLTEADIAKELENSIENLIKQESKDLLEKGDSLFISRLNAKKGGQDSFHVEFYREGRSQAPAAIGVFLERKVYFKDRTFFNNEEADIYVREEIHPFLKELFGKLGFEIVEQEEELY